MTDTGKYPTEINSGAGRVPQQPADIRWHKPDDSFRQQSGLPGKRCGWWQGLLMVLLLGVVIGAAVGLPGRAAADELPFRLHIVANSDSAADQLLKLQVRDAVVEYLTPLVAGAADSAAAEQIVLAEQANLEDIAAAICADLGYGCTAQVGSFNFPPKRYGSVLLPAGEYRALKLNLGQARGHNWWCVIFPPLCFVDECGSLSAGEAAAEEGLQGVRRVVGLKISEIFWQV